MLITTTVTTTKEIEKEVELPYFGKSITHVMAIFKNDFAIKVFNGTNYSNIETGTTDTFSHELSGFEKCLPDEFYKAYNEVFERVTLLSNVPMLAVYDQNLQATIID